MPRTKDAAQPEPEPSYAQMLRAVGIWLDEEDPSSFTVVEVGGAFLVLYDAGAEATRHSRQLSFSELTQREKELRERRGKRGEQSSPAHWSMAPSGRGDALRALGRELDETDARDIMIDQAGDRVILSFLYVEARESYQWHKGVIILDHNKLDTLIRNDRNQRQESLKGSLLSWLWS